MKKSSFLGLVAIFFLLLIAAASGVYVFSCSGECPSFLIKGSVLVIISIAFFCLLYSLFESIKEIELAELKKEEKQTDFNNKRDWEEFVFGLNERKASIEGLLKEKEKLEKEKKSLEDELKKLKALNENDPLTRDEQIKQMYTYMLLAQGKAFSEEDIKKAFEGVEKSYEEIKKHLK